MSITTSHCKLYDISGEARVLKTGHDYGEPFHHKASAREDKKSLDITHQGEIARGVY